MSTQEFEQMDVEVIAMVNQGKKHDDTQGIATPVSAPARNDVEKGSGVEAKLDGIPLFTMPEYDRSDKLGSTCRKHDRINKQAMEAEAKAENFRKLLWLGLKVFLCGMAAALFLAAMLDPDWVPVLGYSGIAFFLVTAAIQIDRAFWRKQHG